MSKPKTGQVAILCRKFLEAVDGGDEFSSQQFQSAPHQDQVCIIRDVAAGCAEMNNRFCGGTDVAKGVHVGHHIMPQPLLVSGRRFEIDIVNVGLQFIDLGLRDLEPQLPF